MEATSCHNIPSIVFIFVSFFLLFTRSVESNIESEKMKSIKAHLEENNKPFVKSITSPDGDIIDCVLFHLQPAFDNPELKGRITMDLPEMPNGSENTGVGSEIKQLWNLNGESCPNGTIPIRRTSENDFFRFPKVEKKISSKRINNHEYGIGYVDKDQYYGMEATMNVWAPNVTFKNEFSLSQVWVANYDQSYHDINTIEAGWIVYRELYNDSKTRLFTFWTSDGYGRTGCYNLECKGFVQTNSKISLGAAIVPVSEYNGEQFEIPLLIWKDSKTGNWWLAVGGNLTRHDILGYWPSNLFTHLRDHATTVQFGGEIVNHKKSWGEHTSTQMGSGHFPSEGFKKAAYIRNLQVVDQQNKLNSMSNLKLKSDNHNCYDVKSGYNSDWGSYIYFGGPGKNPNCP